MSRQIMFRTRYIKTFILAVAAVAAACTADPADPVSPDPDYDDEPASLTIDVSIADLGIDVSTRAAGADTGTRADANTPTFSSALSPDVTKYLNPDYSGSVPTTDPELTYYNQAKSIDGSVMTCLTVILVHRKTNRIVAIRRIPDPDCPNKSGQDDPKNALFDEDGDIVKFDDNGNIAKFDKDGKPLKGKAATRARLTFDYEKPYHVVTEAMVGTDDSKKKYIGKSAERLVRGEYSIMVVANYDHSVTTSSLKGSGVQTLNVNKVLNGIAKEFHKPQNMAEGIGNFNPRFEPFYDIRFLMNRTLERVGSDDGNDLNDVFNVVKLPIKDKDGNPIKPYIRPAVQQTLSAAKEFYLEANNNHLELELLRISSRTRVEVKNNSTTTPLKVHSLEFSNNYTQSTIYLFRRNKNDRDYGELANKTMYDDHDGKGAPIVSYTGMVNPTLTSTPTYGAIVPFDEANGVDVSAGEKKCIFDALMYESNVKYKSDSEEPDSYTYTIDVSYPGITNYRTTDKNKLDPDKTITENVDHVYRYEYAKDGTPQYLTGFTGNESLYTALGNSNTSYFLIQSVGSQQYLFEKDDETICAGAKSVDLEALNMTSYLWTMEVTKGETGDLSCTLKNVKSGRYMGAISKGTAGITSVSEAQQPFSLSTAKKDDAYNVAFATSYDGTPYYLNVWGGGLEVYHGALGGWSSDPAKDPNSQFYLYPLTRIEVPVHEGTPRIKKKVKLTTFNDETAIVEDVHEIQRNDFVRILVEVSCNPDKSDFDFEVNSWVKNPDGTDKGGDVTFN